VSAADGDVTYSPIPVPDLRVVVAVPEFRLPTVEARRALPRHVPLTDAVFNIGRTALVTLALERGDYELLARAMDDRLHQPYRARLIPGLESVFAAARAAGAAGVALSGAGPSVVAFAPDGHEPIGQAMVAAFTAAGLRARALVLDVDRVGAVVVSGETKDE